MNEARQLAIHEATRKSLLTQMENLQTFVNTKADKADIDTLQTRKLRAGDLLTNFSYVEGQIFQVNPSAISIAVEFSELYYTVDAKLSKLIRKFNEAVGGTEPNVTMATSMSVLNTSMDIRLPKITIEPFAGNYTQWQSFYDVYMKTIRNSNLTAVQKFTYLKGYLRDEAANLIKYFPITEANYFEAFKKLVDRYGRKKHTIQAFVRTFLDQPIIKQATASNIRKLLDVSHETIRGLRALGEKAESRDVWLLYLMESKLDAETKLLWAQHSCETDHPTLDEFFKFLLNRSDALEATKNIATRDSLSHVKSTRSFISTNVIECWLCSGEHYLSNCDRFNGMSIRERRECVKAKGCCFNCLKMNHAVFMCKAKLRCTICQRKHSTLLHPDDEFLKSCPKATTNNQTTSLVTDTKPDAKIKAVKVSSKENLQISSYSAVNVSKTSILPTALVKIIDRNGVEHRCRVLLDSGSMTSLVNERFCNQLGLTRIHNRTIVSGLGGSESQVSCGEVQLRLRSLYDTAMEIPVVALVLSNLCAQLPSHSVEFHKENIPIFLADPKFGHRSRIDMILGVRSVFDSLLNGRLRIDNGLTAVETIFGWVLGGEVTGLGETQAYVSEVNDQPTVGVDELLQRFWQIEHLPEYRGMTDEERQCEEIFKTTTFRNQEGRFVVQLPVKQNTGKLGASLNLALSRQSAMEKKFNRMESFGMAYKLFMEEYRNLGHMIQGGRDTSKNYLPHHGVVKELITASTKIRVVFDASSKTANGTSLNEMLMAGLIKQATLYEILLRFREFKIAVVCDVEKMYRQILVQQEDRKLQQIVWRSSINESIQYYELTTLTYGMKLAPYIATRVLEEVAKINEKTYPEVSKILRNHTYMDDIMFGSGSVDDAMKKGTDLRDVLSTAGMKLRKWVSNSIELLSTIPDSDRETLTKRFSDDSLSTKVLGLQWNPVGDVFCYSIELGDYIPTKRGFLPESSRIFDPLGWLAPAIISIKMLFQELWLKPVGWDDVLPETVGSEWLTLRNKLQDLRLIRIPRWLQTSGETELHGFCDASKRAYAAAVYARHKTIEGEYCTRLIAAKSRVAPVKSLSIARLELCAAVLLVQLMKSVVGSLSTKVSAQYYWIDSIIVLDWLSDVPSRWEVFEANQTSKILQETRRENWYHVPTSSNAADCASWGITPRDLVNHELWWNGPPWLKSNENWPKQRPMAVVLSIVKEEDWLEGLASRISSFHTIMKVVARSMRLFYNARNNNKNNPKIGLITREEICEAELVCWRYVQNQFMKEDISNLTQSRPVKSSLKFLNPFISDEGVVRVGGRLRNANVPESVKHPIIIPTKTKLAKRLVEEYHLNYRHAGPQLLLGLLRQKYWLIRAKDMVRLVIRGCISCFRVNPAHMVQQMGDLPSFRVEHIRPVIKVGVDFAGPFIVFSKRGRGQRPCKIYVCLFVCESTKAVHIELVLELTTGAFLAAFRRFVGQRGLCTDIYSDCGSNFIGANRELQLLFKFIKENEKLIYYSLLKDHIQWHFMPPNAPHFGGLWEAAVKAFKYHFKRVVGTTVFTVDEMMTLSIEIEAIMNSRPLCSIPDSPEDILTPAHFLLGHSMVLVPEVDLKQCPVNKLDRWQLIQQRKQHFWARWSTEYLTALQSRYKWETVRKNIQINDVVLIIDNNLPPTKWVKGTVVDVICGSDGLARVTNIRTKSGVWKRPIHKICRLPIESTD